MHDILIKIVLIPLFIKKEEKNIKLAPSSKKLTTYSVMN